MGKFIDNVKRELAFKGLLPRTAAAREWLRYKLIQVSKQRVMRDFKDRRQQRPIVGGMYFFAYDPKLKKTLPYYDTFPLVFPIEYYGDGFLGLNMHYLDYDSRALLFDKLLDFASDKQFDESTRIRMSYGLLAGVKRYRMFEPTIKRYLYDHVRSQFLWVPPDEWDLALFIPAHSFEKASASRVWSESRAKF